MNVSLNGTTELYVKTLVESGAFASPESAVNSLIARIAMAGDLSHLIRLPSPFPETESVEVLPDFPRGAGTPIAISKATSSRLPDPVDFE